MTRRLLCGMAGCLATLPLEVVQVQLETTATPTRVRWGREVAIAAASGALFPLQHAARAAAAPPWGAALAALVVTPCSMSLRALRVCGRFPVQRRHFARYVAWMLVHEFVLYLLLPIHLGVACLAAYGPKVAASNAWIAVATAPPSLRRRARGALLDVARAYTGLRISGALDAATRRR